MPAGAPGSGQLPPVTVPAGCWGGLRTLLGGKAEHVAVPFLVVDAVEVDSVATVRTLVKNCLR